MNEKIDVLSMVCVCALEPLSFVAHRWIAWPISFAAIHTLVSSQDIYVGHGRGMDAYQDSVVGGFLAVGAYTVPRHVPVYGLATERYEGTGQLATHDWRLSSQSFSPTSMSSSSTNTHRLLPLR